MERLSDNIFNCGCGHFIPRASIVFVVIYYFLPEKSSGDPVQGPNQPLHRLRLRAQLPAGIGGRRGTGGCAAAEILHLSHLLDYAVGSVHQFLAIDGDFVDQFLELAGLSD
jgi:hypothetical protein